MKNLIAIILVLSSTLIGKTDTYAQVAVSVRVAPPAIPYYVQPPCAYDGYIWSPGYWAWGPNGYYWVPGTWVLPPDPGYLWTPGYWGFVGGVYGWNAGYWGLHVGYYGGVCYGFGYPGVGFYGGRWEGGAFRYNTAVWRVNGDVIHNTYVDRAGIATSANRASFNGPGGVRSEPTAAEKEAMSEHHIAATSAQQSHQAAASKDRNQLASINHGKPATAAMSKPGGQRFGTAGRTATGAPATLHANTYNAAHPNNATHTSTAQHTSAPVHGAAHPTSATHTNAAQHTNAPSHSTAHTVGSTHTNAPQHSAAQHSSATHAPQHASPQHSPAQHSSASHAAPRGGGGAPHGGGGRPAGGGGEHHEGK